MNDTTMTVVGNLVDEPRIRTTKNGHSVTNFRIASTSRRYDTEQGGWVDNATLFVTVTTWRGLAENCAQSLHKGQPVVVSGRFFMREYTVDEATRTSYELEASAVGHDLTRGVAEFRRVSRPRQMVTVPLDPDGVPEDHSDHWLNLSEEVPAEEPELAAAS